MAFKYHYKFLMHGVRFRSAIWI